ncbi:N-formylglutamate amidohydrolase [Novispirillum itersonii]|uniref:N-formylglutamate amidohydrolase n=1 Tax=Novispirillum itersonii TaxID=189 RepID=UPI00036D9682|nr:N-formylglutamate amidohydrolase [Novispirillum itersonii]
MNGPSLSAHPAAPSLLAEDEPQPFEVLCPEGAAPLLLVCDHASRRVPRALGDLGLTQDELSRHIGWDIGAADVTRKLSALLNAPAVLCQYSRLVIDCNRQPGDPTSIPPVSDTTPVPGNQGLSEVAEEARTAEIFWPYHRAIGDTLAHIWRRQPQTPPVIISVHSFTPCMRSGQPRPWHLGFLFNRDERLTQAMAEGFRQAYPEVVFGLNEPYSGKDSAYTMDAHATAAGLAHVGLEIRQDLIGDDAGTTLWAGRLATVLDPLLGRGDLHQVVHF